MIPLNKYDTPNQNRPYKNHPEFVEIAYKDYKASIVYIKTNQTYKAKTIYKTTVKRMQSNPESFDIAAYLRIAKLGLLLNHEKGPNNLDEAEKKIIELRAKVNDAAYSGEDANLSYLIACSILVKLYFPINSEKSLTYLNTIETNSNFIDRREDILFNSRYLTKCYIATNQTDKCINLVKNIVEYELPILTSTEQAWTLLKFTRQILPLDTDYAKTMLQLAAKTILPLKDKVLEKELKHVKLFADLL